MLEIINNLKPFFEDCHRRFSVREYAKIIKVSPPTASKILSNLTNENLLNKLQDRQYLLFWAKNTSQLRNLAQIYWKQRLEDIGIIDYLNKKFLNPTIILFGSLVKGENTQSSDVDLAIIASKKQINLETFEKKLKRKIQTLNFNRMSNVTKELQNNLINGYTLNGRIKFWWIGLNVTLASKISLAYDFLRELLEALTLNKGFKIYNHECYAAFLKEILNESDLGDGFNEVRKIRNDINYYGQDISIKEAKTTVDHIKNLKKAIKSLLKET